MSRDGRRRRPRGRRRRGRPPSRRQRGGTSPTRRARRGRSRWRRTRGRRRGRRTRRRSPRRGGARAIAASTSRVSNSPTSSTRNSLPSRLRSTCPKGSGGVVELMRTRVTTGPIIPSAWLSKQIAGSSRRVRSARGDNVDTAGPTRPGHGRDSVRPSFPLVAGPRLRAWSDGTPRRTRLPAPQFNTGQQLI